MNQFSNFLRIYLIWKIDMIGFYSSFLEFIGALYFSMSLDEILKKKVWGPQDAKKQNRILDGLDDYTDKNFSKAVVDANQAKGLQLQAELSKKSMVGLFVIAFLLVFCGYESFLLEVSKASLYDLHLGLAYTMIVFIISQFCFQRIIFKKWKYSVLYLFTISASFFIIHKCHLLYGKSHIEQCIVNNIGLFTCMVVSLPILWQIFITWLYKSVFYGFIKDKILRAKNEYLRIIDDIHNGRYDNLPKEYHEIYMRNSQKAPDTTPQQALDDSLTEYKGILYNKIRAIGNNVSLIDLFGSWIKYRFLSLWKWILGVFKSKGTTLVSQDKLLIKNYEYYAKRFEAKKKKDRSLRMKAFCTDEKIKFEEFNKYYCSYCNKK